MLEPKRIIFHVLVSFILFVVIDFIWLGFVAKNFYMKNMEGLILIKDNGQFQVNYGAAIAVYMFLALSVSIFVLPAAGESAGLGSVFIFGFLMGLFVYGVYDMTNMATLKTWPLQLALVDMFWGATLGGVTSTLTKITSDWLIPKFF